ncbi:MAG: beta-glucuronidase [Clostridia bacterium]|nr:beta-glucuronidase [Clostridia bacterium]
MLYPSENAFREVKDLCGIWNFKADNSGVGNSEKWYENKLENTILMPVPASYNDITQDISLRDFIGDVWYQKDFYVPSSWKDKRILIRFGSVSHNASVWINGKYAVEHKGGYLPFEAEIGKFINFDKPNCVTVRVGNILDYGTLPPGKIEEYPFDDYPEGFRRQIIQHDFFHYSGIHRPVKIYCTEHDFIDDITVVTDIGENCGTVKYSVKIAGNGDVTVSLRDKCGNEVASGNGENGVLKVENPHLWNVGDGYLYTLEVKLSNNGRTVDLYEQKIGIRTIKVEGCKILLNGKPVHFTGFGRHEDSNIHGKGLDNALNIKDNNLLKWIGANSFRTSHYPYSEELMDIADEEGFLVIDECSAVGFNFWGAGKPVFCPELISDEALTTHIREMKELIARDKNRPCVIMWSVANEAATYEESSRPYFKKVIDTARQADSTRPITIIEHTKANECKVGDLVDVIGVNRYFSWYNDPGYLDTIEPRLTAELKRWYDNFRKPVIITEFGADTVAGMHSDPPQMFSEEYQVEVIKHYANVIDSLDFVVGEQVWNFADFQTKQGITRVLGNKKGIFTRDRSPKMAAHYLKERWDSLKKEAEL